MAVKTGTDGEDTFDAGQDAGRLYGGSGDDAMVLTRDLQVAMDLDGGFDLVRAKDFTQDNLILYTGIDAARIGPQAGEQLVQGNEIANTIWATDFDNEFRGYGGDDRIFAGVGEDRFRGGSGNDKLYGSLGEDMFFVETGDMIFGGDHLFS